MKFNLKINEKFFYILLILQPIFDVIAYFQYDNLFGSLAGYSRLIIMCLLVVLVYFVTNKKVSYTILMGIIALYCVLHLLNGFRVGYISVFQDISYLARVVQMPVLTICFIYLLNSDYLESIQKAYITNVFIISFVVIVSVLTATDPTTYVNDKVGFLGWFGNSNSQSIIIAGLVPMAVAYAVKKKNLILLLSTVIGSTFLLVTNGTKGCYYSSIIIFAGFIIFILLQSLLHKRVVKFQMLAIGIFLLAIFSSFLYYPYSARNFLDTREASSTKEWNEQSEVELNKLKENNNNAVLDFSDPEIGKILLSIYEKDMNKGLVKRWGAEKVLEEYGYTPLASTLADNRLAKRMYAKFVWEECDPLTKLVGFEFTKIEDYDLENDFPAIFYYYGYIGFGLYALFLIYFVFILIKKVLFDFKNAFTLDNFSLLLTFTLLLGLAQYSGALLRRPNASIYLSVVLAFIYFASQKKTDKLDNGTN